MLLAVRISSYGCTWEVWRALKKLELLSAAPRATLTHFSCSPNFPRTSLTRYTHAKHEQIPNSLTTTYSLGAQQSISESTWWITRSSLVNILLQIIKLNSFSEKKKLIYLTNLNEINTQLSGYNRELLVDPILNSLN